MSYTLNTYCKGALSVRFFGCPLVGQFIGLSVGLSTGNEEHNGYLVFCLSDSFFTNLFLVQVFVQPRAGEAFY